MPKKKIRPWSSAAYCLPTSVAGVLWDVIVGREAQEDGESGGGVRRGMEGEVEGGIETCVQGGGGGSGGVHW